MMCGITGTPGTGKTSIAAELTRQGYPVLHLSDTISGYVIERDEERDTSIIDEERWAAEFIPYEGFVEGHLAHLLPCDRIVVLRCRPDILMERLKTRGYGKEKSGRTPLPKPSMSSLSRPWILSPRDRFMNWIQQIRVPLNAR